MNSPGTEAFELYIGRCRRAEGVAEDENAISCLIGHMRIGSVDAEVAHAAAIDETLPPQVRLAAWGQSGRKLDDVTEEFVIAAINSEGYHPKASAAQALSSPKVDVPTVVRLLGSPEVSVANAEEVLNCLISDWHSAKRYDRVRELLGTEELRESLRDRALLYSIDDGNTPALDGLVDRMGELSAELVCAIVSLLGHAPERGRVERIVAAVAARTWSADDRVSITAAFAFGLTYRRKVFSMRSGTVEPIPFHPGRTAPHGLLQRWLALDDYGATNHLMMLLHAVRLGIADARKGLRLVFDAALAAGAGEESGGAALAGRAIEILHADGEGLSLDELEELVRNSSYNLAASAVALIAAGGTQTEANSLMRLYEEISSGILQSMILCETEPLASRLGLQITRTGRRLYATVI